MIGNVIQRRYDLSHRRPSRRLFFSVDKLTVARLCSFFDHIGGQRRSDGPGAYVLQRMLWLITARLVVFPV
ncbi:hypothetical protein, partial [Mixta calida]|uniref:hypothetical protein n=1 Tax=Mixta calida TaxID=665913 RepID=UPI0028A90D2B